MFISCECLSLYYKFILYVCVSVCPDIDCVNCNVCGCVRVQYEYNITLYNLIIRK